MEETTNPLFPFTDPLATIFPSSNPRSTVFPFQPEVDPFFTRKASNDFYDGAFLPDYLNNEDQMSYGNLNFDEVPLKEEKRSYINSFLPQEIIGVYNNQPSEHEGNQMAQDFNSQENIVKEEAFQSNLLNYNEDDENLPEFLRKEEAFEVFSCKVKKI